MGERRKSVKGKTARFFKGFENEIWKQKVGLAKDKSRVESAKRDRTEKIRTTH